MDPADLVRLAAARGIDFVEVAGVASDLKGPARQRTLTLKEKLAGVTEVRQTVKGRETRSYKPPAFTIAELGQAGGGMGEIPWAAAMYSFAGSPKGYWLLYRALAKQAHKLSLSDRWVDRVKMVDGYYRFYRDDLAELVLIEDANRHVFMTDNAHANWMKVSPSTWNQDLDGPYRSLKDVYEGWLGTARAVIARWISAAPPIERADGS